LSEVAAHIANGQIAAADADRLIEQSGLDKVSWLRSLIDEAKNYSRPSVSDYRVGAVGIGRSGTVYLGANLEFSDSQLIQTIHAEQAVVINAMSNGEKSLQSIAISAAPCGPCRQFLQELADAPNLEIWLERNEPYSLAEFLPDSFGPQDLGVEGGLLDSGKVALEFANSQNAQSKEAQVAKDAASASYAPYTASHCGCCLTANDGSIYSGSYVENAAFNPSVSAFHAASIGLILAGNEMTNIQAIDLAYVQNSKVNHRQWVDQLTTSMNLQSVNIQQHILIPE